MSEVTSCLLLFKRSGPHSEVPYSDRCSAVSSLKMGMQFMNGNSLLHCSYPAFMYMGRMGSG
ncbi:unnamed protein product [Staurois parvus]|uniref:Uncharacterized protein n=1 Tax=Staurois parvus TaxID=386267 RepID=A0ABN9HRH5_9NEOB|nr:unnamed protein product [Staurois parvus]